MAHQSDFKPEIRKQKQDDSNDPPLRPWLIHPTHSAPHTGQNEVIGDDDDLYILKIEWPPNACTQFIFSIFITNSQHKWQKNKVGHS